MNKPAIATLANGLTVTGRLTTDHATSSYGQPVFVDDDGRAYNAAEIIRVTLVDDEGDDDDRPSKAEQVREAVYPLVPSEVWPHINALAEAALLDALTVEQAATIVRLMQAAYRNGQWSQGAEKVDDDYVWLDGVGGIERQPDGTWRLVAPSAVVVAAVASEIGRKGGAATSEAKTAAARENGKLGGRPRGKMNKDKERQDMEKDMKKEIAAMLRSLELPPDALERPLMTWNIEDGAKIQKAIEEADRIEGKYTHYINTIAGWIDKAR